MITSSILLILNIFNSHCNFLFQKASLQASFSTNLKNQSKIENVAFDSNEINKQSNWYLEIPNIKLKANIQEGTTKEIMDQFIGHFEESKTWIGNVCLAAHNRGYENNYFSELKTLKEGDKIIYYYQDSRREYLVEKNDIIEATNLSCLENTEDNILTLITCVENEPNYRRCVKATENREGKED